MDITLTWKYRINPLISYFCQASILILSKSKRKSIESHWAQDQHYRVSLLINNLTFPQWVTFISFAYSNLKQILPTEMNTYGAFIFIRISPPAEPISLKSFEDSHTPIYRRLSLRRPPESFMPMKRSILASRSETAPLLLPCLTISLVISCLYPL